jgi:1-acyl-sn-glycerol-3-phosphate acyltransferase
VRSGAFYRDAKAVAPASRPFVATATLARRLVTIPLYGALFLTIVSTLPVLLAIAAGVDLARGAPWAAVRSLAFFAWYLGCEVVGTLTSFGLWLARIVARVPAARYLDWHFRLQWWWARSVLRGAETIFRMRFVVEGADDIGPGPILLFIRHASVGDTVLPAVFVSHRHGIRLRYVMKRELLWDPCLDIVGNRLPNYFVDRASTDSAREIAAIRRLAADVGPGEGVLIYPEGTRFTEAKRHRIVQRLEERGETVLAARARTLVRVLLPRLGGPLGLLEERPDADVVFCAHVGFDRATRFSEFLDGGLVGTTVRVGFWRVPAAAVPAGPEARVQWLLDQWERVDRWVDEHRRAGGA